MPERVLNRHVLPALAWTRVTLREVWRLRILQAIVIAFVFFVVFLSGGLKADGTELGWARLVIKRFEMIAALSVLLAAAVLSAYLIPYEEMRRQRILLTGSWPLSRQGMIVGTAAGVLILAALTLAVMYAALGLRVWVASGPETVARLSGRVERPVEELLGPDGKPVEAIVRPGGRKEQGVASLEPGQTARIVFARPNGTAFVRFMLFAAGKHSTWGRIYFQGQQEQPQRQRLTLRQPIEVPVPADITAHRLTLILENASEQGRFSLPKSETHLLVSYTGFPGNLFRSYLVRVLALSYGVTVAVGLSGFMGFTTTLAAVLSMLLGAYLAPFVSGLFNLPRFTMYDVPVQQTWDLVRAAGNFFGDLAHVSPAERLPAGALIPSECIKLGGLMLLRGMAFLILGAYIFANREVGG